MDAAYRAAARVADFVGKIDRRARRPNTDHRKPPKGVKVLPKEKLGPILLKRDGPLCQCGCGGTIDWANWEDEHKVNLESVKDLPDAERAKYFQPENRRAFIPGHQLRKNKIEAATRAKVKRLAAKPALRPLGIMSNAKADRLAAGRRDLERNLAAKAGRG